MVRCYNLANAFPNLLAAEALFYSNLCIRAARFRAEPAHSPAAQPPDCCLIDTSTACSHPNTIRFFPKVDDLEHQASTPIGMDDKALPVELSKRTRLKRLLYPGRWTKKYLKTSVLQTLPVYKYDTLPSETAIRVMKLLPGLGDNLIKCHLSVVERAQTPEFEALSYVWGDPTIRQSIYCNKKRLDIPVSLYQALRRIRDPERPKWLFADAICIDQANVKERGHQVKQMGWIYSNAKSVLVWLGPENPFEAFNNIQEYMKNILDQLLNRVRRNRRGIEAFFAEHELDRREHDFYSALSTLFSLPWFTRLWVIQEAGLGKSVQALFGDVQMDFDILISLADAIDRSRLMVNQFDLRTRWSFAIGSFPRRSQSTTLRPFVKDFLDLMLTTTKYLASDPHDHVYALLGHSSAFINGQSIVEPDYSRQPLDVFRDLAIKILEHTQNLRILSAVKHRTEETLNDKFPSWVPTWCRKTMHYGGFKYDPHYYDAAAGFDCSWRLIPAGSILQVNGIQFGTVDDYGNPSLFKEYEGMSSGRKDLRIWMLGSMILFRTWSSVPVRERLWEVCQLFRRNPREADINDLAAFLLWWLFEKFPQKNNFNSRVDPGALEFIRAAAEGGNADIFRKRSINYLFDWKIFSTSSGILGLGPEILRTGDICCVLFGSCIPFILRPAEKGYRLVGEAKIPRVMQGEVMVDFILEERYKEQTFDIF
ncbi:HET-domain-containing protein [Lojkania enalia]|uniref:HET-domain-containing protein n=1 Tax=Lojkania enalia TaxID=147567 RepID=A0A9P4K7Y0_9PLEO|nr:HET-domain-containing protein [Didymosphaeria enalia]